MHRMKWLSAALVVGFVLAFAGSPAADPPDTVPGGPCIEDNQNVSLSSLPSYEEVGRQLRSIEASTHGTVEVASAGLSGEGRQLYYATVGDGPDVFWLQARIHGNEPHSTEAVLQILRYLGSSGSAEAQRIRDALTVIVIPMYNPDGATANIRQSTTPFRSTSTATGRTSSSPSRAPSMRCGSSCSRGWRFDLHHFGQASRVQGTDELNSFQIGARSIDPSRMTAEQWLTNRQMAMTSVDALRSLGTVGHRPLPADRHHQRGAQPHAAGRAGPDGSDPGFMTQGAIFYEVRSVGQKSNGMLEQLFVRPSMAVLNAAADQSLYEHPGTGWDALPFGQGVPCGGGPEF